MPAVTAQIWPLAFLLLAQGMLAAPREAVQSLQCHDWEGKPVVDGVKYIPKKDDPCMACVCEEGFPVMCTAVLCSPPECKLYEAVEGECCRFNCLKPDHTPFNQTKHPVVPTNPKTNDVDKTNLGLRLIASTVTSFLILALLVFMVHRLRQRRMLIMMRRMHSDQEDGETVAYMSQMDHVDMGIEFPPYQEPPPPYTPPKPPDIPHGEAPPPYEVTPGGENSTETNNNTNLPGGGRGPRPLQGVGTLPVASSSMDPVSIDGFSHHRPDLPSPVDDSLSISRSTREIQAQSDALTPPGAGGVGGCIRLSPEHEYENLREVCIRQRVLQRAPSSEAETVSAISTPPDFSPDSDVSPLAPAMTMSFHSQGTPVSQMVVRMHNDNPRSHILRDGDIMTTSLPAYLGSEPHDSGREHMLEDAHPWVPSYRTQFIKRSDSIEIKRGSNSPRNSFHTEEHASSSSHVGGLPENCQARSPGGSPRSESPPNDQTSRQKKKRSLAPNVTWNKSCRPFRIRMENTSPIGENNDGAVANSWPGMVQDDRCLRHSSYGTHCITSPSPPSERLQRHSLPPIDLELPDPVDAILGASGTRHYKSGTVGRSEASTEDSQSNEILEVGVSPTGSGQVNTSESSAQSSADPSGAGPKSGNSASTPSSVPSMSSPQSPLGPNMIRSSSITSQVSQFSVCSETGEKKRPRPNNHFPRPLRNDVRYPLSPLSSNYAAPMSNTPPVLKSRSQPRHSESDPVCGTGGNGPSPISSPLEEPPEELSSRNLNEDLGLTHHRPRRNKISYVDVSPERDKSSSSASTPSNSDSSGGYPKHPTATSSTTNDSTMSSLSPLSPDSEVLDNQHCLNKFKAASLPKQNTDGTDRTTPRKVKKQHSQRKRHSHSFPTTSSAEAGKPAAVSSQSPERMRRLSRNVDTSTTFKQYGFIDDPDVINNARDPSLSHNNGSVPHNHSLQRQHSHDGKPSLERRDSSRETKQDNHRERSTSRERKSSSERKNSREQRERSQERKKERSQRNNSSERRYSKGERRERSTSGERRRRSRSGERVSSRENQPAAETKPHTGGTVFFVNGTTNPTLDNHATTQDSPTLRTEGKKRERDYTSQAASLERRKKRRSTGEHKLIESTQNNNYPVSYQSNGVSALPDNVPGFTNGWAIDSEKQQNESDLAPIHHGRRTKNNRTHENRHSVPHVVHRNR